MLIMAGAPLGNIGDATSRLKEAIASTPYIAAEDSRRFARLCQDLGITHHAKVISFFEGNENDRLESLVEILKEGNDLLVITDAGMPGISDPGYRLIAAAIENEIPVSVIPGPSAVTTALLLSGLATDRFSFEGFAPRTSGARKTWAEKLAEEERTWIFFEAPHRLEECLSDLTTVLANRRIAICREMTKTYEETFRGTVQEALDWSRSKEILGELTIVVEGFNPNSREFSDEFLVGEVLKREGAGEERKEAIAAVAKQYGMQKRVVFDAMVQAKIRS
jgi:16S rRNA (cytidine1402-2'-O)-methyltransferase